MNGPERTKVAWEKPELDRALVRGLAADYSLEGRTGLLTASILARRGLVSPSELRFFLEDDLRFLHNPFLFNDMEDAVDRIHSARTEGEKVLVFGDRDVDGITATAILVETLRDLGIQASWRLPLGDATYGLKIEAVEEFAAAGGSLIITVDCGISNLREITRAEELGVDVIVVDHHSPPESLPPACAIINPKVKQDGYPFRDLAGCGVAAKLAWALRFSMTVLYDQTVTLLNVRPGNADSFVLEAVKLKNLVEVDRVRENLVPGLVALDRTRLPDFFSNQLYAYDVKPQERMLKRIFGPGVEIYLMDLAPEVWRLFPALNGKSLLSIREKSRLARYQNEHRGEIDTLQNLFVSYAWKREAAAAAGFEKLLDLVAIGTIADIMPLRDENHLLVKRGLKTMSALGRSSVRELLRSQNLAGRDISGRDVAWQIGPVLNAAGRMGQPELAARLFLSDDPVEQAGVAQDIGKLNQERKRIGEEIWQKMQPRARQSLERHGGKIIFLCDECIPRGLTGIIAARLASAFKAPTVVCAVINDTVVGSLRSARGYSSAHFLERCADLFEDSGGHDFAAGFNLKKERLARLEDRILELSPEMDLDDSDGAALPIDAELPPALLAPEIEEVVDCFAPYGEDNPQLVFLTRGVKIGGLELLGKKDDHVRLQLQAGALIWPAVFWNSANRVGVDFNQGDTVDVVYYVEKNYYQNEKKLQLNILDLRRS